MYRTNSVLCNIYTLMCVLAADGDDDDDVDEDDDGFAPIVNYIMSVVSESACNGIFNQGGEYIRNFKLLLGAKRILECSCVCVCA